jgi:hypothetical protein
MHHLKGHDQPGLHDPLLAGGAWRAWLTRPRGPWGVLPELVPRRRGTCPATNMLAVGCRAGRA